MARFDDEWFYGYRGQLLTVPRYVDNSHTRNHREVEFIIRGSASDSDKQREHVENALAKLSPRHAASVRSNMQFYRSCLELLAIVPPDPVVRSAVEIEWLWYTTPFKKFYRDHLAHVQKVTATAEYLITDEKSPLPRGATDSPLDWIAQQLADGTFGTSQLRQAARRCGIKLIDGSNDDRINFWKQAVHVSLRIAGLLHDMAYPQVMAYKVLAAAQPMAPFPPMPITSDGSFDHFYELFTSSLCKLPFADCLDKPFIKPVIASGLELDHNFQGALRVLRYGVEVDRVWKLSPMESFCIEWAALAILMHDFDKQFKEVRKIHEKPDSVSKDSSPVEQWYNFLAQRNKEDLRKAAEPIRPCFQRDPVSYLLALSDQLQDFGRLNYDPVIPQSEADTASIQGKYPIKAVLLDIEKNVGKLTFLESDNANWRMSQKHRDEKPDDVGKIFGLPSGTSTKPRKESAESTSEPELIGWLDHTGWVERFELSEIK